jgi:late competence protein required for DNA uptake (superfamily II DNA/RNA helicase)
MLDLATIEAVKRFFAKKKCKRCGKPAVHMRNTIKGKPCNFYCMACIPNGKDPPKFAKKVYRVVET